MNVLVLGGTGAMGKHLVNLIAEGSNHVVVTSRTQSGHKSNVEYKIGNAKEETFIDELLAQRWDVIVDFMVYKTNEFKNRYERLLEATDHYIYLSSSRVYADSDKPLTESSPRLLDISKDQDYLATDEYALTKARQENLLFASARKNWTIIRPYITYDEERLQLGVLEKEDWLYRAIKGRSIVFSDDISSKMTTVTMGKDVARGIVALIGQSDALGEAFHITSDISISWNKALDIYLEVLESHLSYRPKVFQQNLDNFLQWRAGKYQIVYDRLYDRQFNNSKINRFIDTSGFVNPEIGLKKCLEHFIDSNNTKFKDINWKEEAIKNRFQGENISLTELPNFKTLIKYSIYRYSKLLK
ncbi:NAD-dependent epimerase/dehydratase family protein [Psychrobacter cibarius]|uniref:NAD-dependent epimerase/dehydratase family protein n=1 Tax=Psychrobacter cibarius TaxID=282669 RepID=UPI0018DF57F4|nr:NAD-dependent epimerase/dehydratase family protein [Psychrobacter cibarius]